MKPFSFLHLQPLEMKISDKALSALQGHKPAGSMNISKPAGLTPTDVRAALEWQIDLTSELLSASRVAIVWKPSILGTRIDGGDG